MEVQKQLICSITIPKYKRTFVSSDEMMAKYYEQGKKTLPLEYCDKNLHKLQDIREPDNVNYFWKAFPCVRQKKRKMINFLADNTGARVVANPNQVGKKRVESINGQKIYSGFISKHKRNKLMSEIKDQFRQFAAAYPYIKTYPLIIECELHDVIIDVVSKDKDWDVDNRISVYNKGFVDTLKKSDLGIILDDSMWYITGPPGALFYPVDTPDERKLVYHIYLDQRPIILNNKLYNKKHNVTTS